MKKILLHTILLLILPFYCFAETATPHVTAYGTATIEVVPDEMHWSIRIDNHGPEIKDLSNSQVETVAAVLSYLKGEKILEKDIQTTRIQLKELWSHKKGGRVKDGYEATTAISFKLTDFDKYQRIWEGLTTFRGLNVNNVAYDSSARIYVQDEARVMAILTAQKKAMVMAQTLKCNIGHPLVIEDLSHGPDIISNVEMAGGARMMSKTAAPSYSLGQIKIERSVRTEFSLKCE